MADATHRSSDVAMRRSYRARLTRGHARCARPKAARFAMRSTAALGPLTPARLRQNLANSGHSGLDPSNSMLTYLFVAAGLLGVFLVNFQTSKTIAPVDRLAISLLIAGVATVPLSSWLLFTPSIALIVLGAIGLAIPTKSFYARRNARRELLERLRNAGGTHGLCPNCDCVLFISAANCSTCGASFGPGSAWKVSLDV